MDGETSNRTQLAGAGLFLFAFVLLVTAQFVPWATYDDSFETQGFSGWGATMPSTSTEVRLTAYLWEFESVWGSFSGDDNWYSSEMEDDDGSLGDGVALVRVGIPFVLMATVATLAPMTLLLLDRRREAAITTVAVFGIGLVGLILTAVGMGIVYDANFEVDPTWHVGLYATIVALLGLVGGAVLGLLPSPGLDLVARTRDTFSE